MLRNIFHLIFALCTVNFLEGQTLYLKMDDTCMDRLEYTSTNSANPYVSYAFKLGDKKFASFDVGIEASKWVNDLPGKVTYCNALKIDREFVQKVNNGKIKLNIVRETSSSYQVASVDKAVWLETKNGNLDFLAEDTEFSLYLNNPASGINLSLPGSKMEVYLDGTINYQCLKGYIVQKKERHDSRSYKEYVIIPELGIVERASVAKTGFVDDVLRDNEFKLDKLDDKLFRSVLSDVCDQAQATYYDGVATTGSDKPSSYDNLSPKAGTTVPTSYDNPCAPTSEPGVHVVQKGETLYAISRKYNLPVAQLQSWNNLADGNVISLCQRLWVKQPNAGQTPSGSGTQTTEKGGEATTSAGGYWTSASSEHQVRSGETVASLAKMYGYTEERFRKMNGLSATETVRPGQRLRTNDCNCPSLETTTKDTPMPYDQPTEAMPATEGTTSKVIDNKDVYYRPITVHLVKSTDTWYSIAKQYNTSVERIFELNGMTKDDKLTTDQRIYVQ